MTLKEREQYLLHKSKKMSKIEKNDFNNFDQLTRTIKNNNLKIQRNVNKKLLDQSNLIKKVKSGNIKKLKLKISKHKIPNSDINNIKMPIEMPKNLTEASGDISQLARDRFMSIYQRGLIEYKPVGKALRTSKYKIHNRRSLKNNPLLE